MGDIYCNLKFRVWKHDMPCASEKIIMAELSRHISEHLNVINVFHDVNSILYTVTNTHPDTGIIPRFCSANYSGETIATLCWENNSGKKSLVWQRRENISPGCDRLWPTIIFKIFSIFLMFYQIFLSPLVKRCAIITYEHGIYKLPHELSNGFRLRILGN